MPRLPTVSQTAVLLAVENHWHWGSLTNCFDLDDIPLALVLFNTGHAELRRLASSILHIGERRVYLFQPRPVDLRCPFALGLVVKRHRGEFVTVAVVVPVLHVFEDGPKVLNAFTGQESQVGNHASNGTDNVSAAGESDKDDLVAVAVVGAKEAVDIAYSLLCMLVLRQLPWSDGKRRHLPLRDRGRKHRQ